MENIFDKIKNVAETGILPDGDHINQPTQMWLEELIRGAGSGQLNMLLCPFCGSKPYLAKWTQEDGELQMPTARVCCECGASGPEGYGDFREKRALDRWNKRAFRENLGNFMNEELSDITKLLEKHGIKPIKKDSGLEIDKSRYELLREMEENEQKNYLFSILNNIDPMVCVLINRAIINFLYQKISERKD